MLTSSIGINRQDTKDSIEIARRGVGGGPGSSSMKWRPPTFCFALVVSGITEPFRVECGLEHCK